MGLGRFTDVQAHFERRICAPFGRRFKFAGLFVRFGKTWAAGTVRGNCFNFFTFLPRMVSFIDYFTTNTKCCNATRLFLITNRLNGHMVIFFVTSPSCLMPLSLTCSRAFNMFRCVQWSELSLVKPVVKGRRDRPDQRSTTSPPAGH